MFLFLFFGTHVHEDPHLWWMCEMDCVRGWCKTINTFNVDLEKMDVIMC